MKEALEASIEKLDVWLQVFAVIVAVGVLGEAIFGVRHILLSRRLRSLTKAEDISRQADIARLNKEAADARKDAEAAHVLAKGFERDIAAANRVAAEANRIAESERLARTKIEEKLAPRRLTEEQCNKIKAGLGNFRGAHLGIGVFSDPESGRFADELIPCIEAAGITTERGLVFPLVPVRTGLSLVVGDAMHAFADKITEVLASAGLCELPMPYIKSAANTAISLHIGPKP
jgi:hypothetical protein